ncbi:hypothetical protein JTB14_014014 [Gonioctena quinquepunctata]|nr:hypothetical protein JTB14_014014 [Gonioctena quinquepunctata]
MSSRQAAKCKFAPNYEICIYSKLPNETSISGHAVKILGWGVDDKNVSYWLIANSWNKQWGEEGFFRMLRGENNCGIESNIVAGLPKMPIIVSSSSSVLPRIGLIAIILSILSLYH